MEQTAQSSQPAEKRLDFGDVAAIGASYAKLQNKRKHKMKRRGFGTFERRYSKLAAENTLIPERKRIDYVLVYDNVSSKDTKDASKKRQLQRHENRRAKFEDLMRKDGFSIQKDIVGENVFVKLHCPFKRLCLEAERVKVQMPLKDCEIPASKPSDCLQRFVEKHLDTDVDVSDFVSSVFSMNKIHLFEGYENPTVFFRPAVRSLLVHHILINIDIRKAQDVEIDGADSEGEGDGVCGCCPSFCKTVLCCCTGNANKDAVDNQSRSALQRKGLPYLLMKRAYKDSFVLHEDSAKSHQKEDRLSDHFIGGDVTTMTPPEFDPRKDLDEKWTKFFKFQPTWHIRDYFGEKIAFYFAWTGMLITTLWLPMIFGLAIFFYGLYESVTESSASSNATSVSETLKDVLGDIKRAFDNDVTPFFALFICCWGTVFLELWKRHRSTLAYEWDVDQFEDNEPDRPQFYGTRVKKDPVTNEDNWFYPFKRQLLKFSTSCSVLFLMVSVVIISVVAVIVYRVVMNIDYCPDMSENECFILTTVISSILNAVSILLLGKLYDKLAVVLTEWENHRTQTKYDDALIIKLFAFQFVNSYASCFYIAFFRGKGSIFDDRYVDSCEGSCMTQLSFQVMILMLAKPFPKFFKDIILPFLIKLWRKRPQCCRCRCLPCCRQNQVNEVNDANKEMAKHTAHVGFLERERLKPSLGDFTMGEYTEKVILYGFLMLFASSFPLAPLLALIICYVDIRVDAKRMLWWYRRPVALIAEDIGMWYDILTLVNFIGVITNAFIIAFTSNWGSQFNTVGKLWVVIGFEHLVFALKYVLAYMIPDVPQDVRQAIRREKYLVQRKLEGDSPPNEEDFTSLFPIEMLNKDVIIEEDENDDVKVAEVASPYHRSGGKGSGEKPGVVWKIDANGTKWSRFHEGSPPPPTSEVLYYGHIDKRLNQETHA